MSDGMPSFLGLVLLALPVVCGAQRLLGAFQSLQVPAVEIEEDIYAYAPANNGAALLWEETALDSRLREKFFPEEKQRHELSYAIVRDGKLVTRSTSLDTNEGRPGTIRYARVRLY
jgi:hypothetical protein